MRQGKQSIIPVREQIFEIIKNAIITNEYKPGELLQIERLAQDFGVSATPIREALIRLEGSGLLTLIPNKGAVITECTLEDVRNTWEMRRILEPYAGKITALLNLTTEIAVLEAKVNSILSTPYNLQTYIETDSELHELLFIHIPNTLFRETLLRIHQYSMRMRYFAEGESTNQSNVVSEVCHEHLNILNALKEKDPELTERSVYLHIVNSEKRTLQSVSQDTGSASPA